MSSTPAIQAAAATLAGTPEVVRHTIEVVQTGDEQTNLLLMMLELLRLSNLGMSGKVSVLAQLLERFRQSERDHLDRIRREEAIHSHRMYQTATPTAPSGGTPWNPQNPFTAGQLSPFHTASGVSALTAQSNPGGISSAILSSAISGASATIPNGKTLVELFAEEQAKGSASPF